MRKHGLTVALAAVGIATTVLVAQGQDTWVRRATGLGPALLVLAAFCVLSGPVESRPLRRHLNWVTRRMALVATLISLTIVVSGHLRRTSPPLLVLISLGAFLAVLVICAVGSRVWRLVKPPRPRRPVLSYEGIGNLMLWSGIVAQVLAIRNTQEDVFTTANNVHARLVYSHADGDRLVIDPGGWFVDDPRPFTPATSVFIPMGKTTKLVHLLSDTSGNVFVGNITPHSFGLGRRLQPGRWSLAVCITADNCDPLEVPVEFKVGPDGALAYGSSPAKIQ